MKTRVLLGALAFPLVFSACADNEFEVNNAGQQSALEGDLIELSENFSLVGVKGNDATTRAGQIDNRLSWLPVQNVNADNDDKFTSTDLLVQENWDNIGLAWLNKVEDGLVYTNYKFTHYGWLNAGAEEVLTDKCNDNVMTNATWWDAEKKKFQKWDNGYTDVSAFGDDANGFAFEKTNFDNAQLGANRGLFRTDLGTVFGGNYLVYYPFNEDLKDAGYLRAISDTEFKDAYKVNSTDVYMQALSPKHFMVGRTSINGGTQSAEFTLKRLTGGIAIQLQNVSSQIDNIKSVVLYANGGNFYKSIQLDATKINGQDITSVDGLYVNSQEAETSKLLVSEVTTPITIPGGSVYNPGKAVFAFVALPVSFHGYTIVVQDVNGNSWAQKFDEDLSVPAGGNQNYWFAKTVTVAQPTADQLYAYDEASFNLAIDKATEYGKSATIHLLGTVELTASEVIPGNVTVLAETPDDKLVLTRQKDKAVNLAVRKNAVIKCNVEIQGQGCCGLKPATMNMNGNLGAENDSNDNYYTITNYGSSIIFGEGATSGNKVDSQIWGTIENLEDPDNEDPETKLPNIVVSKYTTLSLQGSLTNDGFVTVKTAGEEKEGNDGTLNVYDGASLTNNHFVTIEGNMATQGSAFVNAEEGTFTVKVGAQITGKGVVNRGEYICEVNSETRYKDAINNKPDAIHSTTLIRFIDTEPSATDQTYYLEGTLTNKNGQIISFESALTDKNLKLNHRQDASGEAIPAKIGKLTIVSGGFEMNHAALTVDELNVNHKSTVAKWFNIAEKLTVEGDVNILKYNCVGAGVVDLTIAKGITVGGDVNVEDTGDSKIIFAADSQSDIAGSVKLNKTNVEFQKATTNNVGGDMTVTKEGKASFAANSVTTIQGQFANDGEVNIIPQTQVGNGEVAARVICSSFTNFGDTSKWLNDSYPQDTLN